MSKLIPGILAMAAVVVASNILVQYLYGDWLTYGAFTYPLAFLVTDVTNRIYGASAARKVVFSGFIVGIICSLIGSQIMIEFEPGISSPAVALRVAVGSGIAFLTAQLLDVAVFDRLRQGSWWRAPLWSTIVGSAVDTALFFTIAFSASITFFGPSADEAISWAWTQVPLLGRGAELPLWVSLAIADWGVKLAIALLALIPFRILVSKFSSANA